MKKSPQIFTQGTSVQNFSQIQPFLNSLGCPIVFGTHRQAFSDSSSTKVENFSIHFQSREIFQFIFFLVWTYIQLLKSKHFVYYKSPSFVCVKLQSIGYVILWCFHKGLNIYYMWKINFFEICEKTSSMTIHDVSSPICYQNALWKNVLSILSIYCYGRKYQFPNGLKDDFVIILRVLRRNNWSPEMT